VLHELPFQLFTCRNHILGVRRSGSAGSLRVRNAGACHGGGWLIVFGAGLVTLLCRGPARSCNHNGFVESVSHAFAAMGNSLRHDICFSSLGADLGSFHPVVDLWFGGSFGWGKLYMRLSTRATNSARVFSARE